MSEQQSGNIEVIKYLDYEGLGILWEKISNTFLRDNDLLTEFESQTSENPYALKSYVDDSNTSINERIDRVEAAQGTNIDNDTIITKDGNMQTNLILHNDKDNHILYLTTPNKGTNVADLCKWDYSDFYAEAVKDGILENVSLVVIPSGDETLEATGQQAGTYLKFIFNTDSGASPIYVNVSELVPDAYNGSDYIDVTTSNGSTPTISLNKVKLETDLRQAFEIDTVIIKRLDEQEGRITAIEEAIVEINKQIEGIDTVKERVEEHIAAIADIKTTLEEMPKARITQEDIDKLDNNQ